MEKRGVGPGVSARVGVGDHPAQVPQSGEGSRLTPPCPAQTAQTGVPALTPTSAQSPSSLLPPASTLWPPSAPETVSLLPSHGAAANLSLPPGLGAAHALGSPGHRHPSEMSQPRTPESICVPWDPSWGAPGQTPGSLEDVVSVCQQPGLSLARTLQRLVPPRCPGVMFLDLLRATLLLGFPCPPTSNLLTGASRTFFLSPSCREPIRICV